MACADGKDGGGGRGSVSMDDAVVEDRVNTSGFECKSAAVTVHESANLRIPC